jgi:hypothetical protein
MIAAIVAPAGDRSIAKTRDCLVLGLEPFRFDATPAFRADVRFFADFAIRDPPIGFAALPHDRSPTSAMEPAGQDLGVPMAPEAGITTALFAAECQSFLSSLSPKRH